MFSVVALKIDANSILSSCFEQMNKTFRKKRKVWTFLLILNTQCPDCQCSQSRLIYIAFKGHH